jgi:spore maturation protein CgeB
MGMGDSLTSVDPRYRDDIYAAMVMKSVNPSSGSVLDINNPEQVNQVAEKLNTLYNSAKIVLSIIAKPQGSNNLQSGINMRPYEILASGSLLLSDKYEELNSGLVDKKNIVLFDTLDQFKATLARLLKNDSLIESISSSGNQFIQGRFSYDQMAQKIIEKFQELQRTHT